MPNYITLQQRHRDAARATLVDSMKEDIMNELLEPKYQEMLDAATNASLRRNCRGDDDTEWYAEKDRQMRLIFVDLRRVNH